LGLEIGQTFVIKAHDESRRYRVAGIYETGIRDIDKVRIFLSDKEARSLLRKPTGASYIQISLKPEAIDQASEVAARMAEVLHHNVQPWQDREKPWLVAFGALRISSAITVSIFTLIASLAMFNTLAMIVIEKTKDIAILRSMGYERRDITQIFLWQAVVVLVIGAVLGALFGAVVTHIVGQLPLPITGIFKTDVFPILSQPRHYFEAIVTAAIMVMIASLVPARRAARLEPGDIIRGTSQ
jgi:lipoprotein-releasing system permease protein